MTRKKRYLFSYLLLALALVVLFAANLFWGSVALTPGAVLAALTGRGQDALSVGIITQLRLPRAVMVVLLGAALSAAGYLLQTFFANPIAGPFVMGISSGAKLAVALVMVVFLNHGLLTSSLTLILAAFAGLVESLISFAREQSVKAAEINDYLKSVDSEPLSQGRKLYDILMRNNVTFDSLQNALPKLRKFIAANEITPEAIEEAEIQIKYKGYIEREKFIAEKLRRLENIRIPENFDFHSMNALTIEARQKLSRIRPETIGQASRIPGVSPADVNVLLVKFGR